MANTAAPLAKSTIGLKDVVIAEVTKDDAAGATYGELQNVAGAIEATVSPNDAEPDVQYADDIEYDVVNPDPDVSFTLRLADLPLAIREKINGSTLDSNGVLIEKSTDSAPYFAIGFRAEKSNHKYRYVWLYKCRAQMQSETYATREGTTTTRQNGEVTFTAIKRTFDGAWRAIADEGENSFAGAATFLTSVYEPSIEEGP